MSRWTHISGSIDISLSIYDDKKKIPFPDDQIFIAGVSACNNKLAVRFKEYSYPRIKQIVDKYIKDLPNGESTCIYYSVSYDPERLTSSANFTHSKHEEKIIQQMLLNKFKRYESQTWRDLKKSIEIDWIDCNDEAILTIHDDVRYCSGVEMFQKLEKLFINLIDNGIYLDNGYLEWTDEYVSSKYRFAVRISWDGARFMVLDSEENNIIARYHLSFYDDECNKHISVDHSDNWEEIMKGAS